MIPDEDLKRDLERVVEKIGKIPTKKEYMEHGEYSIGPFISHFGGESWLAALENLGYDVSERKEFIREKISNEELKDDLERVVEKLGKVPTQKEYKEHGEYSITPVSNRFGDGLWLVALENLGYDVSKRKKLTGEKITEKKARDDIRRVANEVSRPPTITEYNRLGDYYHTTIAQTFGDGSWTTALQHFGYNIPPSRRPNKKTTTNDEMQKDIRGLTMTLGRTPQRKEYESWGNYSGETIINRLGSEENTSWNSLLEELGYNTNRITKEKVIEDLRRVDNKTTGLLSYLDYNEHGKYSSNTAINVLDQPDWTSALKEAGLFDPDDHPYSPK